MLFRDRGGWDVIGDRRGVSHSLVSARAFDGDARVTSSTENVHLTTICLEDGLNSL